MVKYEKGTFSIVPNMHAIRHLSPSAATVYITLCKFANAHGQCFPGASAITEWSGRDRKTVFKAIDEIESIGLITRLSGGKGKANQYQILLVAETELVAKTVLPSGQNGTTTSGQNGTLTIPVELNKELTHIAKDKPLREKFNKKGSDIIKAFEEVDSKNSKYYSNTTQRTAADFLIETYGIDMVLKVIKSLNITNKMEYFPVITTPAQLRDKWTALESQAQKYKASRLSTKGKSYVAF